MQYELGFPTQSAPLVWDDSHAIPRGQTVTWHFTTPATLTPNCVGYVELVEHANNSGGAAVICPRMGALNFTAGDLTTQIGPVGAGGVFFGSPAPHVYIASPGPRSNGMLVLLPSKDYYFNVANVPGSEQTGVLAFSVLVPFAFRQLR